jgi:hypothetical protein
LYQIVEAMGAAQEGQEDGAARIDISDAAKDTTSSPELERDKGKEGEFDAQPTEKAELKNYLVGWDSRGTLSHLLTWRYRGSSLTAMVLIIS